MTQASHTLAANPAIVSRLQANLLVGRGADLYWVVRPHECASKCRNSENEFC